MKILISGAAGFIGYHLAKQLCQIKKFNVLGIDSINGYYSKKLKKKRVSLLNKNKNFFFRNINLNNKKSSKLQINKFKPDIIYHLAGQPGVLYSFKNPQSYYKNNVLATKNLVKIAKELNIKKFVFASSSSVYGDQKKFPIKENFKLNPKNPYAITKLKSEKIIKKKFIKTKIEFIIFRFFTVYGPFGRPDMFIHKFLNSIKKKNKIYLHNNGLNYRDFTYVNDVSKILKICLTKKLNGKIINISRCNPVRTDKLVEYILKLLKVKKANVVKIPPVKGEMLKTHGSNKKLHLFFGNIKFTEIKTGLKNTIRNFKSTGF